ncbi:MAG: hypothetical protein Q9181_002781 [Wetmoreana brouardii]
MASWQVDIPGLSQLVLGAGAHGLKQLALSGVDIHTLACMLMVSELTPASQGFRITLNTLREKQRNERQWLFNLVEIGAGSSFLVDHLLKTRAGENVLALMASIVPFISPDACIATLSILFDTAGVPLDHTPGVSQFYKLRSALVPFTRVVGFQERVLQYHSLLERIASQQTTPDTAPTSPYDAIPGKHDLPRILQLCHRIATSEKVAVLVYKGFQGSGWVAAYASSILGFPVCAVDNSGVQIPLNDHYGKAKVILEPAAQECACELRLEGDLSDVISVESLDQPSRRGWSVNCLKLGFLAHNLPDLTNPTHISIVSDIVAFIALNQVVKYANWLNRSYTRMPGFRPYLVAVSPQIQQRSLDILSLLGFQKNQRSHYSFDAQFRCKGPLSDQYLANELKRNRINKERLISVLKRRDFASERDSPLYRTPERVCEILERASAFASLLAFTDWDSSLRTMAAPWFHGHFRYTPIMLDVTGSLRMGNDPTEKLRDALNACTDVADMRSPSQEIFLPDWIAINLDGVVVLRTLSTCLSINTAQGRVFSLFPGHISFEGQHRNIVRMPFEEGVSSYSFENPDQHVRPMDVVPLLRSRILFSGYGETLWARCEILNGQDLLTIADSASISTAISQMLVAVPCGHPYSTTYHRTETLREGKPNPIMLAGFHLFKPSPFDPENPPRTTIYYQQVDENNLAQWLACEWHKRYNATENLVSQEEACLECVVKRVLKGADKNSHLKFSRVSCIIGGRTGVSV